MKRLKFSGPGGEREIRLPALIRMVQSSWFLSLCTAGFALWGAYYLFFASPSVFLSKDLSPGHAEIASECVACHLPFTGVPNESCLSSGCHPSVMKNTIHNTRTERCVDCHPVHTGGELIPQALENSECDQCHRQLEQDPESIFFPRNKEKRKVTFVPRSVFRHKSHQFPPHYRCWQCHCTGPQTLDTPMKDLFKMDTCLKCHERKGCQVCHSYHQDRESRPRDMTCVHEQFVPDLQYKTMLCTPYRGREPGFKGLTVCESGEPVTEYGAE